MKAQMARFVISLVAMAIAAVVFMVARFGGTGSQPAPVIRRPRPVWHKLDSAMRRTYLPASSWHSLIVSANERQIDPSGQSFGPVPAPKK
jgi:hypothetical protein